MTERAKIQRAMKKASPLTEQLQSRYDLELDFGDVNHIVDVYNLYNERREMLLRRDGVKEAVEGDDYVRAFFISETAAMLLREIAPKRLRKRNRRKDIR